MAYTPLRTDFKDDILDSSNYKRKYKQVANNDGTFSLQDETTYQQVGSDYGAKEVNEERAAINNIYENKLVALDDVALVTEEGFFVDALAVKELNNKLKNAETTMNNNLKSLLSEKQVTVKSNINVGAGKDFEYYIKAPTVRGYTPVGIIGYDLVGNWDVWINVSSCYYNSASNLIYTKGHNFGTGASNALLNTFVLYKKN